MRFSRITGLPIHVTHHEDTLNCRGLSNIFRSYPSIPNRSSRAMIARRVRVDGQTAGKKVKEAASLSVSKGNAYKSRDERR